jgi:protein-S-isoprenylcysteine O-methyltransferase Ste14
VSARDTKETVRGESSSSRLVYSVPLIAGGVLLGVPHVAGPVLDQRFHAHTFGWFLLGLAAVAPGLGLAVAARLRLGTNWSGRVTLKHGHELIVSGPYALVRHPIYTGILLALTGTALAVDRWRALIALPLVFVSLVVKLKIEERLMAKAFGKAYARYRVKVPALIPFIY